MEKLFGLRWNRIRERLIWGTLQAFTWILTGILIVATLLILLDMINTAVLETIDVMQVVPHIMDSPS